jgi:hypothetical protein
VRGDIPLELVSSAAVAIILVPRSITAKNLGVVFAEKAEAIANQAKRLPCKWLDFLIPNLTITFRPPAQP